MNNKELYKQLNALKYYSGQYSKNNSKQLISGETGSLSSFQTSNNNKLNTSVIANGNSVKKGCFFSGKRHIFTIEDIVEKQLELDETSSFRFEVCNILDPFNFYVQVADDWHEEYFAMDQKINQFYKQNEKDMLQFAEDVNYDFVKLNGLCVARLKAGARFYRGLIISIEKMHYKVFFIDFGEFHFVSRSNLFPIMMDFLKLAQHVVSCQLDTIEPIANKSWSLEANLLLKRLLEKEKFYKAKIISAAPREIIKFNPNKSWPVFIENDGKHKGSINDILVVHGHAKYFEQDKNDLLDDLHESVSVANGFWPNSQFHRNVSSTDTLIPPSQENVDAYKSEALVKFIEDTELFKKEIERAPSVGDMNFKSTAIEPNKMTAEIKNEAKVYKIVPELENHNPIKDDFESVRNAYGCKEENIEQRLFGYG